MDHQDDQSQKPCPLLWGMQYSTPNGSAAGCVAVDVVRSKAFQKARAAFAGSLEEMTPGAFARHMLAGAKATERIADAVFRAETQAIERAEAALREQGESLGPHGNNKNRGKAQSEAARIEQRKKDHLSRAKAASEAWGAPEHLAWEIEPGLTGLWVAAPRCQTTACWPCEESPIEEMAQAAANELRALAEEVFGAECILFSRMVSPEENEATKQSGDGVNRSLVNAIKAGIERQELEAAAREAGRPAETPASGLESETEGRSSGEIARVATEGESASRRKPRAL